MKKDSVNLFLPGANKSLALAVKITYVSLGLLALGQIVWSAHQHRKQAGYIAEMGKIRERFHAAVEAKDVASMAECTMAFMKYTEASRKAADEMFVWPHRWFARWSAPYDEEAEREIIESGKKATGGYLS